MSSDTKFLAEWHYTPEKWREYVEYEKGIRSNEIPEFLKNAPYYAIATIIILGIIALLSFELAAGFLVLLIVPALLALAVGIHWLIKKGEVSAMTSQAGRVQIFTNGVNTNGLWFDWEFDGNRSRFVSATRSTTYTATGTLNLLEFKCLVVIVVKGSKNKFEKKWRVPIPNGKEYEADILIQHIYQARALFSESDSLSRSEFSSKPLGLSVPESSQEHDFTASTVCLRCGSSIEAATHFKWKCKK